jgi:hypothetical protein
MLREIRMDPQLDLFQILFRLRHGRFKTPAFGCHLDVVANLVVWHRKSVVLQQVGLADSNSRGSTNTLYGSGLLIHNVRRHFSRASSSLPTNPRLTHQRQLVLREGILFGAGFDAKAEPLFEVPELATGLIFTKFGLKQTGECFHHGIGIASFGGDYHLTAMWRCQSQHIQDALAIRSNSILDNPHIGFKKRRHPYDLCGRPGMKTLFVGYDKLLFQNTVQGPY